MDKILGRSGACGAGKVSLRKIERVLISFANMTLRVVQVRGTWRQPQSNTAFPILTINIVPECPSAAHQGEPKGRSLFSPGAETQQQPSANMMTHMVKCIDLSHMVNSDDRHGDVLSPTGSPEAKQSLGTGTAAIARRVYKLEEMLNINVPQEEREQAQLEETVDALRAEVSALSERVEKWKRLHEDGDEESKESYGSNRNGSLSSPPHSAGRPASAALTDLSKVPVLSASIIASDSGVPPHEEIYLESGCAPMGSHQLDNSGMRFVVCIEMWRRHDRSGFRRRREKNAKRSTQ